MDYIKSARSTEHELAILEALDALNASAAEYAAFADKKTPGAVNFHSRLAAQVEEFFALFLYVDLPELVDSKFDIYNELIAEFLSKLSNGESIPLNDLARIAEVATESAQDVAAAVEVLPPEKPSSYSNDDLHLLQKILDTGRVKVTKYPQKTHTAEGEVETAPLYTIVLAADPAASVQKPKAGRAQESEFIAKAKAAAKEEAELKSKNQPSSQPLAANALPKIGAPLSTPEVFIQIPAFNGFFLTSYKFGNYTMCPWAEFSGAMEMVAGKPPLLHGKVILNDMGPDEQGYLEDELSNSPLVGKSNTYKLTETPDSKPGDVRYFVSREAAMENVDSFLGNVLGRFKLEATQRPTADGRTVHSFKTDDSELTTLLDNFAVVTIESSQTNNGVQAVMPPSNDATDGAKKAFMRQLMPAFNAGELVQRGKYEEPAHIGTPGTDIVTTAAIAATARPRKKPTAREIAEGNAALRLQDLPPGAAATIAARKKLIAAEAGSIFEPTTPDATPGHITVYAVPADPTGGTDEALLRILLTGSSRTGSHQLALTNGGRGDEESGLGGGGGRAA